jgi:hypothetical protein
MIQALSQDAYWVLYKGNPGATGMGEQCSRAAVDEKCTSYEDQRR